MHRRLPRLRRILAFTLLELSVSIAIIGIMMGSTMVVMGNVTHENQVEVDTDRINAIVDALVHFKERQGYVPCPAALSVTQGTAGFGKEANSGDCTYTSAPAGTSRIETAASSGIWMLKGAVPIRDLGLRDDFMRDEHGNRYTYAVMQSLTEASTFDAGAGGIIVKDSGANSIITDGAFVVVSHGKEGEGAYSFMAGTARTACGATNLDIENCDADVTFIDTALNDTTQGATYFSDLIRWKSKQSIITPTSGGGGGGGSPSPSPSPPIVYGTQPNDYAFRLDGVAASDASGHSVAIGDINGDGFGDAIIGAPDHNPFGGSFGPGAAYVVFGTASGIDAHPKYLSILDGTNGFVLTGSGSEPTGNAAGYYVAAGDINGDGFDDVIVDAPYANSNAGYIYVVFGKASGWAATTALSSLNGTTGVRIDISGAAVGYGRITAGDINNDGYDDLSILPGGGGGPYLYVLFGKASGWTATLSLAGAMTGTNGFTIYGGAGFGGSVFLDINGDGYDDLVYQDGVSPYTIYVVWGKASGWAANYNSKVGFTGITGPSVCQQGCILAGGDVNGDGFDDIVISSWLGSFYEGYTYVVFGSASFAGADLSGLNGTTGFRLDGEANSYELSGSAVAVTDLNGDTFADIIIGAPDYSPYGDTIANVYVVYGKASGWSATHLLSSLVDGTSGFKLVGSTTNQTTTYNAFYDSGISLAAGDYTGDNYGDILIGMGHANYNFGSSGTTYGVYGRPSTDPLAATNDLNTLAVFDRSSSTAGLYESLEAYWKLDEASGNALDIHEGNNLTETSGTIASAAGKINTSRDFELGDTEYFTRADNAALSAGDTDFTISAWVKAESSLELTMIPVVSKGWTWGSFNANTEYALYIDGSAAKFGFWVEGSSTCALTDNQAGVINPGSWYHVVGWHDSVLNKIGISVNGYPTTPVSCSGGVHDGTEPFSMGKGQGTGYFDGVIDEVGFWRRVLTTTEKTNLYNGGSGRAYSTFATGSFGTPPTDNAFRLDGANASDYSGGAAAIGDINGDGFGDTIIGANNANSGAGYTYVVFGTATGINAHPTNLSTLDGTTGFRLDGTGANNYSGTAVSSGDVNNDGFDDVIVGAFGVNGNRGYTYVVFGKSGSWAATTALSGLDGTTGFRLDGANVGDMLGISVSSGDVNNDGYDDVIVGAKNANSGRGYTYTVFGKSGAWAATTDLSTLNGTTGFRLDGTGVNDLSGQTVDSGDVNGDGFDDVIVGAYTPGSGTGYTYVVFGKSGAWAATTALSSLNGTTGFRLDGVVGDAFSIGLLSSGDINNDGYDDVIVGAQSANSSRGYTYVVFGKSGAWAATTAISSLNGTTGFRLDGENVADNAGNAVGSGDINGDGFDDVVVGASGTDYGSNGAGSTYVIFGKAGAWSATTALSSLNGTTGFRLSGTASGDASGITLAVGDMTGDNYADILIGAYGASYNGISLSGSTYGVYGKNISWSATYDLNTLAGIAGGGGDCGPPAGTPITGITYSVSSDYSYTGYTDETKMHDGSCNASNTAAATNNSGPEWVKADLGANYDLTKIHLAPIPNSFGGWGSGYIDGREIECSTDDSSWSNIATASGHADNTTTTYNISATCRYVRVYIGTASWIGIGDFWFEGSASGGASCNLPWGGTINDGDSVDAYEFDNYNNGNCYSSETRTCTNGSLSGSYSNIACRGEGACDFPWNLGWNPNWMPNGGQIGAWATEGGPCNSETLTCTDGTWSPGGYTYYSCTGDACNLPWGGIINNGNTITAYEFSSGDCSAEHIEDRYCNNSVLTGSFTNQSCTP